MTENPPLSQQFSDNEKWHISVFKHAARTLQDTDLNDSK